MRSLRRKKARQSKISDFDVEIVVNENVGGFNITVDGFRSMEKSQRTCCLYGNLQPCNPWKLTWSCLDAVKMIGDRTVRYKLINQQEFTRSSRGASVKGDKMWVVQTSKDLDFI